MANGDDSEALLAPVGDGGARARSASTPSEGLHLRWTQFKMMMWKIWLFSIRSRKSTAIQLLAPLIFVVMVYGLKNITLPSDSILNPEIEVQTSIPECFSWNGDQCVTIIYAPLFEIDSHPETLACMDEIVGHIANVSSLEMGTQVVKMASLLSLVEHVYTHPNQTASAVVFGLPYFDVSEWCSPSTSQLAYNIFYNGTKSLLIEALTNTAPATPDDRAPMQTLIEGQFLRMSLNRSDLEMSVKYMPEPVVDPVEQNQAAQEGTFDTVFFYAGIMFQFVMLVYNLTVEKELKLRQALRIIGLRDVVYWTSWFMGALVVNLIAVFILMGTGYACGLIYFTNTDFGVNLLLLFVYSLSLIFFAFFVSAFVSTTRQAVNAGMLIFVVGLLLVSIVGNEFTMVALYDDKSTPPIIHQLFSLIPPFNLAKPMADISSYASREPPVRFTWSDMYVVRTENGHNNDGPYTFTIPAVVSSIWILIGNCIMFGALAWYLDNVKSGTHTIARGYLFFLQPSYWGCGSEPELTPEQRNDMTAPSIPMGSAGASNEDGGDLEREQEQAVSGHDLAFRLINLKKTYRTRRGCCSGCCFNGCGGTCGEAVDNHAVNGLSLTGENGTLVALLGHNGAGKSTTINFLTGLLEADSGDALLQGKSVRHQLNSMRHRLGVCPQHDILWSDLTAIEHVRVFAGIKLVPVDKIEAMTQSLLTEVRLWDVRNDRVGTYSGGMKRRLSVALAFVGSADTVFLDEPTTGMDPYVRRDVWNMILKRKSQRVILLTTHSMEEADILGDKIGIMARGELRCVGTSVHLKSKYSGYMVTLVVPLERVELVIAAVEDILPGATLHSRQGVEKGMSLTFRLHTSATPILAPFFEAIEDGRVPHVLDYSCSQTTLEQVFVTVTEQAEAEYRQRNGLDDDDSSELGVIHVRPSSLDLSSDPPPSYTVLRTHPRAQAAFFKYTESIFCDENVSFYEAVQSYTSNGCMSRDAHAMLAQYILSGSENEINIRHETRNAIVDRFDRGEYVGLFNDAADEILALMDSDTMPQFLRSSFREQL